MPNIDNIKKYKNIHMIGIGGVSMSGIAAILLNWGFHVTGSDRSDSETLNKLNQLGIKVTVGHNLEDVAKSDVVVYSAAVKQDDPEMQKAKELNIPTIERADLDIEFYKNLGFDESIWDFDTISTKGYPELK